MNLRFLNMDLAVCKVKDIKNIDFNEEFISVTKTSEEISLICRREIVPENCIEVEYEWDAFKVEGKLDFSLIGIIAKISKILAENGISIFVVSTFNTDYILIKQGNVEQTKEVLSNNGYEVR